MLFSQSFIWCGMAAVLAPVLPTMAVLALCFAGYFSVFVNLIVTKKIAKPFTGFDITLGIYALITIVAAFLSVNVASSLYTAALTVAFSLFAVAIYHSVETKQQLDLLIDLIITIAALLCVYGILQFLFGFGYQSDAWTDDDMFSSIGYRVGATFNNPNMFGQYLILMIPIVGARFLECKDKLKKFFYFVCAGLMCINMLLTFSRGAWLGLMFAAVVFVVLANPKLLILVPIVLVIAYFVLPDSIVSRFTSIGNMSDKSTSYRVAIWLGTINMLLDGHWLFGVGTGEDAFEEIYPLYEYGRVKSQHSHNLFLQHICDGGIFYLISLLAVLLVYVRTLGIAIMNEKDKLSKLLQIGCLSGILGFCVQGMTDYSFYNNKVKFMFFVVLGVGILCSKRSELKEEGFLR